MNTPVPMPECYRVLVIDDTPTIHDDIRKILAPRPAEKCVEIQDLASSIFGAVNAAPVRPSFNVDCALQGEAGLGLLLDAKAQGRPYALAFVDMRMPPGWNGIETIRHLWAADPSIQIVICTAFSDTSWDEAFRILGNSDSLLILKKPFDSIEALQLAHALTKKWTMAQNNLAKLASLDGTVRQRTTELAAAEERFSEAFNASPLPQAIQDLDTGNIVEVNAAFEKMAGLDDNHREACSAASFRDLLRDHQLLHRLRSGQPVDEHEIAFEGTSVNRRDLRCSSRAMRIAGQPSAIWVFRDVTENILLEQQVRQGQKMEAVGQLAAGIAHDFNNLLTVILSYSTVVLDDTTLPIEHRTGIGQVCAAAQRAAALTRQLLIFSRRQISTREPIDLDDALQGVREMLSRLLPERIKLEWSCGGKLPPVLADAANAEQILMNLVVNARDAISECGTIKLNLREVTLTEAEKRRHPDARSGTFVCLSVADDGKGMEPSIVARIFEPFFTTKGIGQGTGLGLSTVYGIAHQHDGWIEVTSAPHQGTTFDVYLPAMSVAAGIEIGNNRLDVARPLRPG